MRGPCAPAVWWCGCCSSAGACHPWPHPTLIQPCCRWLAPYTSWCCGCWAWCSCKCFSRGSKRDGDEWSASAGDAGSVQAVVRASGAGKPSNGKEAVPPQAVAMV